MEMLRFVVVLVALCATSVNSKKQVSDFFTTCHRSDPDISECIKKVLEDLRPSLTAGIPELKITSIDPLVVPRLAYREGTGNFYINQIFNNMTISGLSDYLVKNVRSDLDKLMLDFELWTPLIRITADYQMEGKILVLPVRGEGECQFNLTGVTVKAHIQLQEAKKKDEIFYEVEIFKWDFDVTKGRSYFTNLFSGDKRLGDAANEFFNENWRETFTTYKHLPEEALGTLFKDISNNVFKAFPAKELYPD